MHYKPFTEATVIITGAASGIGRELVVQLLPSCPKILAVDLDLLGLKQLKTQYPEIHILQADLSEKSGNEKILDWVQTNWERVDFCFANAGKAEFGPAESQNWKEMDRLFQLNVHSPIQVGYALREAFPGKKFRLVITASAMSFWTIPGYSLYASTKSALLQWARTVWLEKSGNWLTLVFPIATATQFFHRAGKKIPKAFPVQSASLVASTILHGVAQGRKKIFPSPLFLSMLVLNRFFRFIRRLYQTIEYQKYKKWQREQADT
ncbi:SDR family NAD(P)-dependent oxidoreductase [Algoriphagus halophytocola]|uniref:SDR family NAD(P)-dependent oxidoreductase n=1 Tax=Algoriphagus halophytocola TaxID=2991499 RepID=A0ABY6MEM7_9BACT|nr:MULTISPECIES: SDR family NAD(P)-dependent oxidoreductase [unclassified Algoriphagus]UZD22068.1 SDR family NAD(P)-dependent oxidoreductase [Algoriphagus sp. TR-M5]WBL43319.1 SDR family NAD(P)-dependent oxidoreductase [Algoriphagus sp. TR-M9]